MILKRILNNYDMKAWAGLAVLGMCSPDVIL